MRERGFTLVEMLVALGITALATLLIAQGLGGGLKLIRTLDRRAAAAETVEAAQMLLRERLIRTFPATRFDASAPFTDFTGSAQQLVWLTLPGKDQRPASNARFRLRLTTEGELLLGEALPNIREEDAVYSERILLRGVERIELAYWGGPPPRDPRLRLPSAPDTPPAWQPEWTQRPLPPPAVRLRLAFAHGDDRAWPELVVRTGATIDTQCSVDPMTGRCRGRAL